MFIFSIIASIFWALVVAVVLWVLCAFSGRLVHSGFRFPKVMHLLCFVVAVPTVVLLIIVFTCNKLNRLVSKVDNSIVKVMMADGRFVEQLNRKIASKGDTEDLKEYISEKFSENISSEFPLLGKYIDADDFVDNLNLGDIAQGADAGKAIVQLSAEKFTAGIRSKIKSARRKALIVVVLLQAVVFGAVLYRAGKYSSPAQINYSYESNDYL